MTSDVTVPGFYAVPGLMSPELIWIAIPYMGNATSPVFTAGLPYVRWATGSPYTDWDAP